MTERIGQRLDKWLWYARVVKTRGLAARLVAGGGVRVNRERVSKPSRAVYPGDVITAAVHRRVKVLRILAAGARRGPAAEAQTLYEDMSPVSPPGRVRLPGLLAPGHRDKGAGRPTKRDRRRIEAWTARDPADAD